VGGSPPQGGGCGGWVVWGGFVGSLVGFWFCWVFCGVVLGVCLWGGGGVLWGDQRTRPQQHGRPGSKLGEGSIN